MSAHVVPVVVAEIVRSGFVEGHHYGSVVALDRRRAPSTGRSGRSTTPVLPRSCNKPIQALGMVRARARPAARPAGAGLRVALRRALPRRRRPADPGLGRPRRDRAADARRLPARRRRPRGACIRAGGEQSPILMNCSGKHAAMLATCVVNGWDTATYRDPDHPLQQAIADDLRRAHRRAGRGGGGRRLRRAAALHLAGRARAGLPRPGRRRPTGRSAGSRTRSGSTRRTSPAPSATSSRCSPRSPARSARPAPSPATPSRCPTGARSRSRPTTAPPRVRPVLMAEALRRCGVLEEPGVDAEAVRRTGVVELLGGGAAGR